MTASQHDHRYRMAGRRPRGFTLLELLVVVAIAMVLASLVGAALSKVRAASRGVMCANNLKTVTYEFFLFADDYARSSRGDSDLRGGRTFRLEDFQEKLYRIDEFWDAGSAMEAPLPASQQALMCPAGPRSLVKYRGLPCSQYAVGPAENVSTGFNMRLDQVSTVVSGWPILRRAWLTSRILEQPQVPLVFDVDGQAAHQSQVLPYYAAPPAGDNGPYGTGMFWFPAERHGGKLNVGFIGGHVLNTPEPGNRVPWNWKYQPPL